MAFLNALFTAALDNNLMFAQLIGMVSVILIAARPQDSWRFGVMIAVATAVAGALGWPLYTQVLQPWGVTFLAPLAYVLVSWTAIVVTATVLGSGKTAAERERLLRVCPIVACNAAVLAVALGNAAVAETLTWDAALGASVGAGLGVLLAVVLFAFVRSRIECAAVSTSVWFPPPCAVCPSRS